MQPVADVFTTNFRRWFKRFGRWVILDLAVLILSYTTAYSTRSLTASLDYREDFAFIAAASITTIVFLYLFGVYNRIWSQTSGHGVSVIIGPVMFTLIVLFAAEIVITPRPLPLSVVLVGNILSAGGLVTVRYRSRVINGIAWRWRVIWYSDLRALKERVLIVGAGESGQTLAWRLKHRLLEGNYQVIGFIDDDPEKQGMYVESTPVLGTRTEIAAIVELKKIDLIIMAVHNIGGKDFRAIISYCEQTNARIKVVPDMLGLLNAKDSGALLRDVQPEDLIGRSIITRHEAVDLSPVTGKVVLVTGAAGSIGSELSRQLASYNPEKLILLDNNESALHDLALEFQTFHPQATVVPALVDVTVLDTLQQLFEVHHPQVVFHAAAYKHVPLLESHPTEAIRVNIIGTRQVAELAQEHRAERFVLISTDKAVNPSSVMGASKRLCELAIHAMCQDDDCSTLFTVVRFGNVLGSRSSVVPIFNHQIDGGGPVTVTDPEMTRYFMSISEAVNLVIHAACLTEGDDIFVLQMGEVVRILDIAERMIRLRGLRPYEDIDIQFIGVRPGEKMREQLYNAEEKPVDTIHPHIIKLSQWQDTFPSGIFFEKLDHLCHTGLNGGIDIIRELTEWTASSKTIAG